MKGGILRREYLPGPLCLPARALLVGALIAGMLVLSPSVADAGVEATSIATWRLKTIPIPANDVAYDSSRDVVLATVQNKNPSLGNKLVELDPETGTVGRHLYVGSDPGPVALADDGTTAYVGLRGASRIAKVDLVTFKLVDTFSTGADPTFGPLFAEDLEVVPGRNDVVVASLQNVGFSPRHEGVWVFENGVPLPNHTGSHTGANRIEFTGPSTVYGYNNESTEFGLWTIAVDSSGATVTKSGPGAISGFQVDIEFAAGSIYSTSGLMVDPSTGDAVQSYAASGLIEVTPENNRVTFLSESRFSVFNRTTGESIESRSFSQMPPSASTLVATATGFAVASESGVSLIGPLVGGGSVNLPSSARSTIDGFAVTEIAISAAELIYDDTRRRLYVSVPKDAPAQAERVLALDSETGAVVASIFVGSNPGPLAITDDHSQLFVGLRTTGQIKQIDLATFLVTGSFSLGASRYGGPLLPEDIEVRPGTTDTLAVSIQNSKSPRHEGVAIYKAGIRLPEITPDHTGANRIEFADSSTLYGTNNETSSFEFYRMNVGPTGVRVASTARHFIPAYWAEIDLSAGLVYSSLSQAIDPANPEQVGRFGGRGAVEAVPASDRLYLVRSDNTGNGILEEYDLREYRLIDSRSLADFWSPSSLVSMGEGLAAVLEGKVVFLTKSSSPPPPPPPPPSRTLQTPYSVWVSPAGQGLDWTGHWVVPINNPRATEGQDPPSYIYAQTFWFSDMRATGTISLGTGPDGKFASFIVVKPDGRVEQAAIAYNWAAEKAYFLYAQHLGGGRWGAWLVDGTTGASTSIGSLNVSAQHQKASVVSVTTAAWYAAPASDCSNYPEAKVVFLPPVGYAGGQIVTSGDAQSTTTAGDCRAVNQPVQNMIYYGVGSA